MLSRDFFAHLELTLLPGTFKPCVFFVLLFFKSKPKPETEIPHASSSTSTATSESDRGCWGGCRSR